MKKLKKKFRPGHADFTYFKKYGIRDYRGGGRASARETAMRVAAGAIAQKILGSKVKIKGALIQVGKKKIDEKRWNWNEIEKNDFFCPDKLTVPKWKNYLKKIRKDGSSIGAIIQINVSGVPIGLGEPVFDKVEALLACLLYTSPSPRDRQKSRMPSSA